MTTVLIAFHLLIGAVYSGYGVMTAVEMRRGWSTMGFSHFGAAWIAMAFTCGPMHISHAVHLMEGHVPGLTADLLVTLGALPAGVGWFLLRVEAFTGGRGDRFVDGDPWWVMAIPLTGAAVATALVVEALHAGGPVGGRTLLYAAPLVVLVWLYLVVAWYVGRTQMANREPLRGWSLSGLALFVIFPTCAGMHGVEAWATLTGRYPVDLHTTIIALLGIPATVYFVLVVRALQRGSFRDWNRTQAIFAAVRERAAERPRAAA